MTSLLLALIYLSFISLGLPDALLGAAWPTMYPLLQVPLSYAGIISMIISMGTITSSLMSHRLTGRFGPGRVTAFSVAVTALALFGFSCSRSFLMLCLIAVPYGLGAGGVDACLNNYVALHYESRHMSWLHCMWGIGASVGPYIMAYALSGGQSWGMGYRYVAFVQIALTAVLFVSLPLWKNSGSSPEAKAARALSLGQILRLTGVKEVVLCFFCYCALEQTAGLWAGSYLVLKNGLDTDSAAGFAGLFYLGITLGRAVSGFVTMKLSDKNMIRLGSGILFLALLFIPMGGFASLAGLLLFGFGCAPVYPCIIHSTPALFGAEKSQAIIGVQMAAAYTGSLLMPPLFGLAARHINVALYPLFLAVLLLLMVFMHERLQKKAA